MMLDRALLIADDRRVTHTTMHMQLFEELEALGMVSAADKIELQAHNKLCMCMPPERRGPGMPLEALLPCADALTISKCTFSASTLARNMLQFAEHDGRWTTDDDNDDVARESFRRNSSNKIASGRRGAVEIEPLGRR